MKNKTKLFLGFLALILVSGCTQSGPEDYFTGKQGVTVEFKKDMPRTEMYEEQDLYFNLDVRNMGAYTINGTQDIFLKIWSSRDFIIPKGRYLLPASYGSPSVLYYRENIQLRGRNMYQRVPDYVNIIPGNIAYADTFSKLSPQSTKQEATVFASVCYPYKTTLTQEICIDTSGVVDQASPLCTSKKEHKYSNGQGAPIAITKIEPVMEPVGSDDTQSYQVLDLSRGYPVERTENFDVLNGVRPSFTITIENVGGGSSKARNSEAFWARSVDICKDPSGFVGMDTVNISASIGGELTLECQPETVILGNKAQTQCRVKSNYVINRNYVNLLNIELDYDYFYKTERQITIKKSAFT